MVGNAVARPLLDRRGKCVVDGLLGELEVSEQADQGGEDAARVGAVDGFDRRARLLGRVTAHGQALCGTLAISHTGRTSMLPCLAPGHLEPIWIASFRSLASIM